MIRSPVDNAVVVAYNGTAAAHTALAWALREGALRRRPVHIVYVVDANEPPAPAVFASDDPLRLRLRLAEVVAAVTHWGRIGLTVTSAVLPGPVVETLSGISGSADLLVLGRGRVESHPVPTWLAMAATALCPVVVVRGGLRVPDRRPVAAVVDGSDADATAIAAARAEAAPRDVEVITVDLRTATASAFDGVQLAVSASSAAAGVLATPCRRVLELANGPVMLLKSTVDASAVASAEPGHRVIADRVAGWPVITGRVSRGTVVSAP